MTDALKKTRVARLTPRLNKPTIKVAKVKHSHTHLTHVSKIKKTKGI